MYFFKLKKFLRKLFRKNKTLYGYVRAKHIILGKPGCSKNCPIALALKEVLPDNIVMVGPLSIDTKKPKDRFYTNYDVSGSIIKWIRKFDRHEKVQIFQFKIENDIVLMYDEKLGWI